ncbi:MAG: VWA domain-containing protein [Acidobacteria bacterium]|nr:VWA domain-containing protein [Acidobacteriota bacterium]
MKSPVMFYVKTTTTSTIWKFIAQALLVLAAAFSQSVFAQETKEKVEQQEQQPTFKFGTMLITVPVVVTDRYGRFVTGLNRNDFSVYEDGASQKIETFSSIESPFSVALLIDTSRSTQNKLAAIRKAALAFIKQLQPRDRVMIVTFDEKVRFVSEFTNDPAELERAVKSLKSSYLTSLYDSIYLTINEKMSRVPGRKAIVILTDGVDTASKQATFESSLGLVASTGIISYTIQYETRNDGAPIMKPVFLPGGRNFTGRSLRWQDVQKPQKPPVETEGKEKSKALINLPGPVNENTSGERRAAPSISPGSRPATRVNSQPQQFIRDRYLIAADFMRSLAVQSGARYLRAENIENTTFAFQLIAEELRHQYTITYISSNEARDGSYRSILVNLKRDDLLVRARMGYRSQTQESAGSETPPKP